MLTKFDWLRRCRTGSELLATLKLFENPATILQSEATGVPFSAFQGSCLRCKIYPPDKTRKRRNQYTRYCEFCKKILTTARAMSYKPRHSIVIWGYVNQISRSIREMKTSADIYGFYIHDDQRFLLMLKRWQLRQWLQELVIYHGDNLKGLIQIFPTVGEFRNLNMGDYLTWAVHHEASLPMGQLWVRFYTKPYQLINPRERDQEGLLTYVVSDFLHLLEMVEVFRANLRPDEQKNLYELLNLKDTSEVQFYWGRFLGQLSQEAKDMLSAWNIRQWQKNQINLFYKLINYVVLPQSS